MVRYHEEEKSHLTTARHNSANYVTGPALTRFFWLLVSAGLKNVVGYELYYDTILLYSMMPTVSKILDFIEAPGDRCDITTIKHQTGNDPADLGKSKNMRDTSRWGSKNVGGGASFVRANICEPSPRRCPRPATPPAACLYRRF